MFNKEVNKKKIVEGGDLGGGNVLLFRGMLFMFVTAHKI